MQCTIRAHSGYCTGIWQSISPGRHLQSGGLEGNLELGSRGFGAGGSVPPRRFQGGKIRPRLPTIPTLYCALQFDHVVYQWPTLYFSTNKAGFKIGKNISTNWSMSILPLLQTQYTCIYITGIFMYSRDLSNVQIVNSFIQHSQFLTFLFFGAKVSVWGPHSTPVALLPVWMHLDNISDILHLSVFWDCVLLTVGKTDRRVAHFLFHPLCHHSPFSFLFKGIAPHFFVHRSNLIF